jgi:hypothetical protein
MTRLNGQSGVVPGASQVRLSVFCRLLGTCLGFALFAPASPGQQNLLADAAQSSSAQGIENGDSSQPESKRLFGIVPTTGPLRLSTTTSRCRPVRSSR